MSDKTGKLSPVTTIQWTFVILTFSCLGCCGLMMLWVNIFGPPFAPDSGMFVIKNRSGSQIQVLDNGSPRCWLKPSVIGCPMGLDSRHDDSFSVKMLLDGKIEKRTFTLEFDSRMNKGLTTLAINHRGEMKVESIVERE